MVRATELSKRKAAPMGMKALIAHLQGRPPGEGDFSPIRNEAAVNSQPYQKTMRNRGMKKTTIPTTSIMVFTLGEKWLCSKSTRTWAFSFCA